MTFMSATIYHGKQNIMEYAPSLPKRLRTNRPKSRGQHPSRGQLQSGCENSDGKNQPWAIGRLQHRLFASPYDAKKALARDGEKRPPATFKCPK